MKLLRLKITDPAGFRSLQSGFEHHFRSDWRLQDELAAPSGFAPFVCAGPNGSGKSNLLEALAAIFYQLELLRVRRNFLPACFLEEDDDTAKSDNLGSSPDGYELDYLIHLSSAAQFPQQFPVTFGEDGWVQVKIVKQPGQSPEIQRIDADGSSTPVNEKGRDSLLPEYVLGYSSGENEILSLPFFKMRFIQFDEYWNSLTQQQSYPGRPDTRMAYMDSAFSQAILLCNLLYQDSDTLKPFQQDMGLGELKEFRIVIKRTISISAHQAEQFGESNPAITIDHESKQYQVNLVKLLEADHDSASNFDPTITRLKRCASCYFIDESSDSLYLDFFVDDATRQAFSENFEFEVNRSPIALFQAFQVLLTLNLFSVSDQLKSELYQSSSHYVSETVPVLASDERIMRFKFVKFAKEGIEQPVMLKDLSDGEHQLLHSLGLCMLFKNTNSLFLLDEPETHFNPDWRSSFISRLGNCFKKKDDEPCHHEMLITTHSPFLISDSKKEKVLVFSKDIKSGKVNVEPPGIQTFGSSINNITFEVFNKTETIGEYSNFQLKGFKARFDAQEDKQQILKELKEQLGDSIEKVLLTKTILDSLRDQ